MRALSHLVDRISRSLLLWAAITVLALAVTACSAFIANAGAVRVSGTAVYDVNPLASRADLEAAVRALAGPARGSVTLFYTFDTVFPLLIGFSFAGAFAFGLRRLRPEAYEAGRFGSWILVPLVATLVDWAENVCALWLTTAYPPVDQTALTALVVVRWAKLVIMAVVAVCLAIGAAGLLAPRDRTAVSRTRPGARP